MQHCTIAGIHANVPGTASDSARRNHKTQSPVRGTAIGTTQQQQQRRRRGGGGGHSLRQRCARCARGPAPPVRVSVSDK
ncbi:unnamed protein product [Lampetra planeri]